MDLSLPRMDGWEATRRLKADRTLASIPIVVLSPRDDRRRGARASVRLRRLHDQAIDENLLFEKLASTLAADATILIVDDEPFMSTCSSRSSPARATGRSRAQREDALATAAREPPTWSCST